MLFLLDLAKVTITIYDWCFL